MEKQGISMIYRRIPRVFRLEYLLTFLKVISKEGWYDREKVKEDIFHQRSKFEEEKFKALGRGYRLKATKSEDLMKSCYQLCTQTGLLRRINGDLIPTKDAKKMLQLGIKDFNMRILLIDKLINTYLPVKNLLFFIRDQKDGKVILPLGKERDFFKKVVMALYQLPVDQITFQVVRDLCTQLDLLNWRESKNEVRTQHVYLTSNVAKFSELMDALLHENRSPDAFKDLCTHNCLKDLSLASKEVSEEELLKRAEAKGYLIVKIQEDGDYLFVKGFDVEREGFEQIFWEEYLKMTDYKSQYPVYYSELRDSVCERLRISDSSFDDVIKRMINRPLEWRVKVYAGGGPMPPRRGLSSMLKALPPKTGSDEYITFLKASK
jgi:hypothetical protein